MALNIVESFSDWAPLTRRSQSQVTDTWSRHDSGIIVAPACCAYDGIKEVAHQAEIVFLGIRGKAHVTTSGKHDRRDPRIPDPAHEISHVLGRGKRIVRRVDNQHRRSGSLQLAEAGPIAKRRQPQEMTSRHHRVHGSPLVFAFDQVL
jgi:hypothetical protein